MYKTKLEYDKTTGTADVYKNDLYQVWVLKDTFENDKKVNVQGFEFSYPLIEVYDGKVTVNMSATGSLNLQDYTNYLTLLEAVNKTANEIQKLVDDKNK